MLKHAVSATVTLILISCSASAGTWPTFRNGPENSGRSAFTLGASSASATVSERNLGGLIWATPVIDEQGRVFVGSTSKKFHAYSPSGEELWSASLLDRPDSLIDSAAALAPGNQVVVPGGDGDLHSYDRDTGRELWTFHAYGVSDSSHQAGAVVNSFEGNVQVGTDGSLYAGSDNGTLYSVDANGKERWHFKTGMMVWSSPVLSRGGDWLAFGSLDGKLYLLDPANGALLASLKVGSDIKATLATDGEGTLFFGASDGKFRAVRVERDSRGRWSLRARWSFATSREVYSSAAIGADAEYFGSIDGKLYALDRAGKLLWSYGANSAIASSPLLTADGAIVFGAANGKLYALDARTGDRLWSYRTRDTERRVNLDSSVALDAGGNLWVGSYQGVLYRIGAAYCAHHLDDARCERGGREDTPRFGLPAAPAEGATLRYEDPAGNYADVAVPAVGIAQPIHLRLAVYRDGRFVPAAAISALGLRVQMTRDGTPVADREIRWNVSSDGRYLNIEPAGAWSAGARYRVKVCGRWYPQSDWVTDRLQWLTTSRFRAGLEFEAKRSRERVDGLSADAGGWFLHSLYLSQPQAMDTYVPAGLDGQAFVLRPFAGNGQSFHVAVLPAIPRDSGYELLAEPARATLLEGQVVDGALRVSGSFMMSAMGAGIPFREFELLGELGPRGTLSGGEIHAIASCLGVRGNAASYHFPYSIVDQVCDPSLRMIAYASYRADALPASAGNAWMARLSADAKGEWEARLTGPAQASGRKLVTAALLSSDGAVLAQLFTAVDVSSSFAVQLPGFAAKARPGAELRVLVGEETAHTLP